MDLLKGEHNRKTDKRTLIIGGSITVLWLTSCLAGLNLTELVKLLFIQQKQSS